MISNINQKRYEILKMFTSVSNTVSKEALQESGLIDTINRLKKSNFRIALVAPFSAGKSTFVNALIGTDLLSMNVLAETAAITTLKYGPKKKIVVNYLDGTKEIFPNSPSQQVSDEQLKKFLKIKTTVNQEGSEEYRQRVEDTIESVDVYWDLPLCKDGVEIVDTPGLFARHNQHDQITNKILPTVNAILFIIEPDNVGDSNFVNIIADYIENAKNSNLDPEGKHIFFILNKVDKFKMEEILKAREELYRVVSPLLSHPQILAVSSYFALTARMYDNGRLSLNDLKRDLEISFVDEDGFVVSGRQITESDLEIIHSIGRMGVIEDELSGYFEYKISRIVNDAIEALTALCEREIKDSIDLVHLLQEKINQKEGEYEKKLSLLMNNFQQVANQLKKEIERDVISTLMGTSSGKSEIEEVIEEVKNFSTPKLVLDINKELKAVWKEKGKQLTEENSEQLLNQFLEQLLLKLQTKKKTLIRSSFQALEKKYESFTEGLMQQFSEFENKVNNSFNEQLNLPSFSRKSVFFQKDQLLSEVRNDIETLFSTTSYNLSSNLKERLVSIKNENTYTVNAAGFFNKVKALFGRAEKVSVFNFESYRADMNKLVDEIIVDAEEEIRIDANGITKEINNRIIVVNEKYQKQIFEQIGHYQSWRKRNIENLNAELMSEKGKALDVVDVREKNIEALSQLLDNLDNFYEKEFLEKGEVVYEF